MGDMSTRMLIDRCKKICTDWDNNQVLIMEYTTSLDMWIATLKHLGAAIAVAFKDTRVKAQQMRDNQSLFVKQLKTLDP